jgi:uncharacterized protein YqjF (DUF2071 family)
MAMPVYGLQLTTDEFNTIAWGFLGSEFAEQTYADWPMDRRVDAYLLHHGLGDIVNDGSAYNALLEHVMANIGPALRKGLLAPPNAHEAL